jgi:hypothetical protein
MTIRDANIDRLVAATDWGLDDCRPAWIRALGRSEREADRYPSGELVAAKRELKGVVRGYLESWYESRFDESSEGDPIHFNDEPEALWRDLVFMNEGVFAQGPDPLDGFVVMIPSLKEGDAPLILDPQLDGWGVASG